MAGGYHLKDQGGLSGRRGYVMVGSRLSLMLKRAWRVSEGMSALKLSWSSM